MRASDRLFRTLLIAVLLCCVVFLLAYVPLRANLRFQQADVSLSLETSQGRERKQQAEYDAVVETIPQVRAELEATQPLADAAATEVAELKALRKELRAQLAELEAAQAEESEEKGGADQ